MSGESYETIAGRYGISITRAGHCEVTAHVPQENGLVRGDGSLRPAVVLMAVDMACGMSAGLGVVPNWTVTADTEIRFVGRCGTGPLRVDARCVRPGRHQSLAEARAYDEGADDALVAVVTANHGVLVPEWDTFMAHTPIGTVHRFRRPEFSPSDTLEQSFGIETVADAEGRSVVVSPLDERTRNPWGIFHGGLTGLLVEDAAATAGIDEPRDMVMRFMRAVREGPVEARVVDLIDRGADRVARIEVRDVGADRLAVVAHVSGVQRQDPAERHGRTGADGRQGTAPL